jgi:drug/metabolite transporter (DMT)-like permease
VIDRKRENAIFMLVLLVTVWGTTFAVTQLALADVSPVLMAFLRFTLSFFIFSALSPVARDAVRAVLFPKSTAEAELQRNAFILGLALAAGYVFQFIGLQTTTTSKSAFLTSTTVIWTPIFVVLVAKVRLHALTMIAIAISIVGIGLLTDPFPIEQIIVGDLWTVGCAVSFGWYIFWLDRTLPKVIAYAGNEERGVRMIATVQLLTGSLWMLPALVLDDLRLQLTDTAIYVILYTTIFATALSTYMQSKYQKEVTPVAATLIYTLEPVVATIVAYLFMEESLATSEWVGALLIVAGMLLGQVGDKRT